MEYEKGNLLDDTTIQPCKFRTRNWVEINYESWGSYNDDDDDDDDNNNNNNNNNNNSIKFNRAMKRSSLCYHSDSNILVKEIIIVPNTAGDAAVNDTNEKIIFKHCVSFTSCITKINNTQVHNDDNDIKMLMYKSKDNSDAYSKTSGSLWQYYRYETALDANNNIIDFLTNNNSNSLQFKQQITKKNRKHWHKRYWNNDTIKISK